MTPRLSLGTTAVCALLGLSGCTKETPAPAPTPVKAPEAPPKPTYDQLSRLDFNRRAAEENLPLFWRTDKNGNKAVDPDELAFMWGGEGSLADFVDAKKGFTARFKEAYAHLRSPAEPGTGTPEELERRKAVLAELAQGRTILLETDFSSAPAEDQAIVTHLVKAASLLERIHARQKGTFGLDTKLAKDDTASRALFFRNQGPECEAPRTENDPNCSALPDKAKVLSGLYPAEVQKDPKFCEQLSAQPNAKELMDHFSVVVADEAKPGAFKAVPYQVAYKEDMESIAVELEAAAKAITSETEKAFQQYLAAAATAFRSNDWEPANEAWAAMGVNNSKWYLRIAPDEVYYEPCAWKAGFAMAFARINKDSLAWQQKLEPVKGDMEKALAKLAGRPYKARDVQFKLPDFIDIILNAGDARPAHGATIGQSLPNWGKVAESGGRTVAMTNLYTDADSQQALREQMSSLFCAATMGKASTEPGPAVMSTVLHEAAHNLGPAHEYKVKGKEDDEIFGGPLASTLEELKAQTAALYFSSWLVEKGVIPQNEADLAGVRDVAWAFGHVSRGMYSADGKPKNYSQLASIQLGTLIQQGALVWKADEAAANAQDKGCFEIDFARWRPAIDGLAQTVLQAKGRGDKQAAEKLKADFVDADDAWKKLREVITERWLRAPKASFVYSVRF